MRALVQVMQMFREGVLIMDEVDMLLHPLKSELNFPIVSHSEMFSLLKFLCTILRVAVYTADHEMSEFQTGQKRPSRLFAGTLELGHPYH